MEARPNILMIVMDDQRADAMGCAGHPLVQTPCLDGLAAGGVRLTGAHCMGSMIPAVCVPSRAMLHTGRSLGRLGNDGSDLSSHPVLGACLREAGYHCHGIGKWHNGPESYARSFDSGAEIFFGGMGDPFNLPLRHFDPSGRYEPKTPVCADPARSNRTTRELWDHVHCGRHASEIFADAAVDFLKSRPVMGQPFFLQVAFTAPHDPRLSPEPWASRYEPACVPLPDNFLPEHPFDLGVADLRDELLTATPRDSAEVRSHLADYYGMISHADEQIGRILQELEQCGFGENTMVLHTGDHGLAIGSHGLMGKQNLYEHSTRVPLIVRGPGLPGGEVRDALCYHHDLFSTICRWAGANAPVNESVDLNPVLRDAGAVARDHLVLAYGARQRAVVAADGRKLIRVAGPGGVTERLFDLRTDPSEREDLTGTPWGEAEDLREILSRDG